MSERTCSIEGCEKPSRARGWCPTHWKRWKKHGDPLVTAYNQPKPLCSIEDCTGVAVGHGWCSLHWQRWRRNGDPLVTKRQPPSGLTNEICLAGDCGKPRKALGWCAMHYMRWTEHGSLDLPEKIPASKPLCSISGCSDVADCRGWCNKHYLRWRNNGDPLLTQVAEVTLTCWEEGCGSRRAKAGVCWTHHRHYKAEFTRIQGNRCAICGVTQEDAPRKVLLLDHDHVTGRPRALLCHHCNCGLGHFRDNPARMLAAIAYLERTGTVEKVTPLRAKRRRQPEPLADVIALF